jgi:hypothetical protein
VEFDKIFFQRHFFELVRYRVTADRQSGDEREDDEATIKILVPAAAAKGKTHKKFIAEYQPPEKGRVALTATSGGNGTVDALDCALRLLLEPIYPFMKDVRLVRYGVTNTAGGGAAAEVEVFILASNKEGNLYYSQVSSVSVIEASFYALSNIYNRYFRDDYVCRKAAERAK